MNWVIFVSLAAFLILFWAISQYWLDSSIPMYFLFRLRQATAVVPEPMNGSRTIFALVDEMIRSISAVGNGAGWGLLLSWVNSQTSPYELAPFLNLNYGFAIR